MQVSPPLPEAQRLVFGRSAVLLQTTSYFLTNFCSDMGGTWKRLVCDLLEISAAPSFLKKKETFQGQSVFKGAKPSSQISLPSEMGDKAHQNPPHISRIKSGRLQAVFLHSKLVTQSVRRWFENHQPFLLSVFNLSTVSGVPSLSTFLWANTPSLMGYIGESPQ